MSIAVRTILFFLLVFAAQAGRASVVKDVDSTFTQYYDNGKVKLTGIYRNGEKHGKWKEYTEEGLLLKTTKYKKGDFKWERLYNKDGKLVQITDRKGRVHKVLKDCGC